MNILVFSVKNQNVIIPLSKTMDDPFVELVQQCTIPFLSEKDHCTTLAETLWELSDHNPSKARFLLYEFVIDMVHHPHLKGQIDQLMAGDILWKHPNLQNTRDVFHEQDSFIENPPDVEEGVVECRKCKSRKTFSFSKQTRRGDESTTVFVKCSQCSSTFRL